MRDHEVVLPRVRLDVLRAVMRVHHDHAAHRAHPLGDVPKRRPVPDGDERLRAPGGQRGEAAPEPGREDERGDRRLALRRVSQKLVARARVVYEPSAMGRSRRIAMVVLSLAALAGIAVACATGAVDVQGCRQIETARCQAAPACPTSFNLSLPVHNDDDVTACIRFYNDQCLHGLETTVAPGSVLVNACVAAIVAAEGKVAAADRETSDAGARAVRHHREPAELRCLRVPRPSRRRPPRRRGLRHRRRGGEDASDDGG